MENPLDLKRISKVEIKEQNVDKDGLGEIPEDQENKNESNHENLVDQTLEES